MSKVTEESVESGKACGGKRQFSIGANQLAQESQPSRTKTCLEILKRWFWDYVNEWRLTDAKDTAQMLAATKSIASAINASDIVCFVKPGGVCPYCKWASQLLLEQQAETKFSLHVAEMLSEDRDALRYLMEANGTATEKLLYPAVFIKGNWLPGGYEELKELCDSKRLGAALDGCKVWTAPETIELPAASPYPLLRHQAGGGQWLTFQTRIYGNVLRGIAFLQVCLLLAAYFLNNSGRRNISVPLYALLAFDSLVFFALGPTPLSPLGCVAQSVLWYRRGSVVPILPYKLVMLYYCMVAIALMSCGANAKNTLCDLLGNQGQTYALLLNSVYLTVFRF